MYVFKPEINYDNEYKKNNQKSNINIPKQKQNIKIIYVLDCIYNCKNHILYAVWFV